MRKRLKFFFIRTKKMWCSRCQKTVDAEWDEGDYVCPSCEHIIEK